MASGYFPAREADFVTWLDNFSTLVSATPTAYGLTAADATALATMATAYVLAYNIALSNTTRTPSSIATKDAERANVTTRVRELATIVQANPAVTDSQKSDLGITVRKTTKTPVPPPSTSPLLSFVAATPLQHTLRFADQNTPDVRAKPFGVTSMSLWMQVGGVSPADPSAMTWVGAITKQPVAVNLGSNTVGLTIYYLAKWQTRTGLLGPQSTVLGVKSI